MAYVKLLREIWQYGKGHREKIIFFFIFHLLSLISMVLTPLVFAKILNSIQAQNKNKILDQIVFWTFIWLVLFLWFNITHRIGRYFEFNVAFHIKKKLKLRLYQIVTHLPLKWHTDHHSGNTMNRIHMACDALFDFTGSHFLYLGTVISFIGPLVILFFLSWQIGIGSLLFSIFVLWTMTFFDKPLINAYESLNEKYHKVSAILFDFLSNIKTIITLRLGKGTMTELSHSIDLTYKPLIYAETWVNAWKWFLLTLFIMMLQLSVIFFYVWQNVSENSILWVGNIVAIFQYIRQLTDSFSQGAQQYQQIIGHHTHFKSIESIVNLSSVLDFEETYSQILTWKTAELSITQFSYGQDKPVLKTLNLKFSKSEKIALIGESGSGKSTLMSLLRGLYEPEHVKLKLDQACFETLAPLFDITTLIPQDPEVFENSIDYNLTMGLLYSEESIQKAIYLAGFDKVLKRFPKGRKTDIREKGISLSGGERQRLALARGILAVKNHSIILMDEPTSSVDISQELLIYDHILSHFKDQTVISSFHRLNLLPKFDRIIVMNKGQIVQEGHFDDLKNETGLFKILWEQYQVD